MGKRPGMKPVLGLAARSFDASSDVREVFDNNGCSRRDAVQNRARKNMVTIPSETRRASREVLQVSSGTLRTVGLQLMTQAEAAFLHFTPVIFAVKAVVRSHGGAADAEVNPESRVIVSKRHIVQFQDNVQSEYV